MTATKSKAPYFDATVNMDVEVEIDPDDLHGAGWHHKSECAGSEPQLTRPLNLDYVSYHDAVASLHRQAHPGQPADLVGCREEPCRSLSYAQLRGLS